MLELKGRAKFLKNVVTTIWGDLGVYDATIQSKWVVANAVEASDNEPAAIVAALEQLATEVCQRAAEVNGEEMERCLSANRHAQEVLTFYLDATTTISVK